MPKIDVDAVLAAKAPRIARWVPGFVIRWLKRTIHQDEINYILDEYSALPPQQFIQACFKFWGVTYSVEGLENLDPKGRYLFASNHPFGGMDGMGRAATWPRPRVSPSVTSSMPDTRATGPASSTASPTWRWTTRRLSAHSPLRGGSWRRVPSARLSRMPGRESRPTVYILPKK